MSYADANMFSHLIPTDGPTRFSRVAQYQTNATALPAPTGVQTGGTVAQTPVPTAPPAPATTPAPAPTPSPASAASPPQSALSAWDTFYNSPAYQVPLQEGLKGVNTHYAAMGALESGAAMKGIENYASGHAAGALNTYLDDLYRQEALGMSAASATVGVGQGLVSQMTANNNAAASAAGNAALAAGNANAGMWNNIGSSVSGAAGQIAGALSSSYGHIPSPNISAPATVTLPTATPYASMPGGFY